MRVIEAFDVPIRTVALSPDGRYVAAASEEDHLAVYSLVTGERVSKIFSLGRGELTFNPQGTTLIYCVSRSGIYALDPTTQPDATKLGVALLTQPVAGGVAISPDGKILVAPLNGRHGQAKLQRWSAPSWAPLTGFEFWSPFQRLAFSPNGEFIAGISSPLFELRIAVTGGLNGRHRNKFQIATEHCFLSFSRTSETVVFGWDSELHVMETRAGNKLQQVDAAEEPFVDAAFLGPGDQLATVHGTTVMRIWSAETWRVLRSFDWGLGGLTCLAVAADGLTGVCGTDNGRLILFDVDG